MRFSEDKNKGAVLATNGRELNGTDGRGVGGKAVRGDAVERDQLGKKREHNSF